MDSFVVLGQLSFADEEDARAIGRGADKSSRMRTAGVADAGAGGRYLERAGPVRTHVELRRIGRSPVPTARSGGGGIGGGEENLGAIGRDSAGIGACAETQNGAAGTQQNAVTIDVEEAQHPRFPFIQRIGFRVLAAVARAPARDRGNRG